MARCGSERLAEASPTSPVVDAGVPAVPVCECPVPAIRGTGSSTDLFGPHEEGGILVERRQIERDRHASIDSYIASQLADDAEAARDGCRPLVPLGAELDGLALQQVTGANRVGELDLHPPRIVNPADSSNWKRRHWRRVPTGESSICPGAPTRR